MIEFALDSRELENDIKYDCFLGYRELIESDILESRGEDSYCYKCNKKLKPLTYINKNYFYIPCWDCSSKKKPEQKSMVEMILRYIKDYYYNVLLGDRYLQLFIVDDIYFNNTLPHDYSVFKKVINLLEPPSRNDIWFLDWLPGYPKIISIENLQGMKLVNLSSSYNIDESSEDVIRIGEFEITMPEITTVNNKHYSRYNILNKSGDRKSKRLKISKDRYIKFYNTENEEIKSIFRLTKNGHEVAIGELTYKDYVIIKLAIMRNKKFLRLVFEIIMEILTNGNIGTFRDSVFLKNTVKINPSNETSSITLLWNPLSPYKDKNSINISII